MYVLVFESSDEPDRTITVVGPFETEEVAQDKLRQYFNEGTFDIAGDYVIITVAEVIEKPQEYHD